MSARGTLLVAVAAVVGVALVTVPVFGAVGGIAPASDGAAVAQTNETNDTATSNVSFGTRISSFMQASTAETDSSVDAGMWAAEYNRSDDRQRPAVVQSRIGQLERRGERLRDRMARLQAKYENGTVPRVAYRAQASRLTAELNALGESINETDERARAVGVNASQLDRLRTETRNLSGQEVAAVARDLGVGRPDHAGPPEDRGPGDAGPPEDRGPSDAGPPEDRGPGDGGPPEDVGPSKNVTGDDQPGPPGDRGGNGNSPAGDESGATGDSDSAVDGRSNDSGGEGPDADRGADGDDTDSAGDAADDSTGGDTGNEADDAPGGNSQGGGSGGDSNGGSGGGPGPGGSGNGGGPPGRP